MDTIVYFHGYGSSAKTDKVDRIRTKFPDHQVLAFDANVDCDVAKKEVGDKIFNALIDRWSHEEKLIFVGTSLGAWLANELSNEFGCVAILINPCYDPMMSLQKYGVDDELLLKYKKMDITDVSKKTFVIDRHDEVIDHTELLHDLASIHGPNVNVVFHDCAGHRFNGVEFDVVLDMIK